jgi:hypothetical protein
LPHKSTRRYQFNNAIIIALSNTGSFAHINKITETSVAEPNHFYAAPAPGENFDAATAAPVPTLLYSKAKIFKTN